MRDKKCRFFITTASRDILRIDSVNKKSKWIGPNTTGESIHSLDDVTKMLWLDEIPEQEVALLLG